MNMHFNDVAGTCHAHTRTCTHTRSVQYARIHVHLHGCQRMCKYTGTYTLVSESCLLLLQIQSDCAVRGSARRNARFLRRLSVVGVVVVCCSVLQCACCSARRYSQLSGQWNCKLRVVAAGLPLSKHVVGFQRDHYPGVESEEYPVAPPNRGLFPLGACLLGGATGYCSDMTPGSATQDKLQEETQRERIRLWGLH